MPNINLVMPCFNEAERLPRQEILAFLSERPHVHILLVDDGSTDETANVLNSLAEEGGEHLSTLILHSNRGKAEAVRAGVLHLLADSASDWIGYWDADLSPPLEEVDLLLAEGEKAQADLVCGCRLCRLGANVQRSHSRHFFGRVFATIVSLSLNLPVYDTQCGAKLIRSNLAQPLFEDAFPESWLFDVELFARYIRRYGRAQALERIIEVPLNVWEDKPGSRLSLSDMLRAPTQLLQIILRHRRLLRQNLQQNTA